MSRAAVNLALESSIELIGLGLAPGHTYAANSVDTPEEKPFIVMRWEDKTPVFGDRGTQLLTVWVHDEIGDYSRIDNILDKIREILTGMVHVLGADGRIVTQIDWAGDSGDLYDDGFETLTKNASFRVVSRAQ